MKQKKPQLSLKPRPKMPTALDEAKLKEFIQAADFPSTSGAMTVDKNNIKSHTSSRPLLPWERENIRADISKVFNLRLPETYYAKLEYLSNNWKESKHKILMDIIIPEIDKKIKEIIDDMI